MATFSSITCFAVVLASQWKQKHAVLQLHSFLVPFFRASVKHLSVVGVEHLNANKREGNAV